MARIVHSCACVCSSLLLASSALAGPYAPAAGQPGSTAISKDSPLFVAWATGYQYLVRGPQDIANPNGPLASFGNGSLALGPATGNTGDVVSLGDGGSITLTFNSGIRDGAGFDFAVFENGFADNFLELAFVEVSSNGANFFRFPAVSLTPTATQVGSFGSLDPTNLDNLAGKYRVGFGTPFDLSQLAGVSPLLDVNDIHFVRIVDVVGSITPGLGTTDSLGNFVNDPYPTPFASGGFDLEAVGVINAIPEASSFALLGVAAGTLVLVQRLRGLGRLTAC